MRALGTDDSINTCDCCGKSGLKFTVAMETDAGDLVHYGQVCASRNSGKAPKVIAAEIRGHAEAKLTAARAEWRGHPACMAERARFAERDDYARRTGARMVGRAAMEFVREACDAADAARREVAARHGVSVGSLL